MDIFRITDFKGVSNPEPQRAGRNSLIIEYNDRVEITIGDRPDTGDNAIYAREKYRLETPLKRGDDFYAWTVLKLPDNLYSLQNGSMRFIGLWHNSLRGRLALYIDSGQRPRLQMESQDGKKLTQLWVGTPKQLSTGKHHFALHIILGSLTELYIDGVLIGRHEGDNMPYPSYVANQILWLGDGATAQTKVIPGIVCYEIGLDTVPPFTPVDPCKELEEAYEMAKATRAKTNTTYRATAAAYYAAKAADESAEQAEINALNDLNACRSSGQP